MTTIFYTFLVLILALLVMRFLPVETEPFHEDPAEPDRRRSEVRLIGREAPRFPASAEEVLEQFRQIALADQNVRVVEGSVDEGMITFVARSKTMGFRDFITVKAVDEGKNLAKLSVFARPRYNVHDWGVNAARLDRWLQEMDHTFGV